MTDEQTVEKQFTAIGWIRTFTGKKVTPMSLEPEMVDIRDIAHSLSRQCRYNGHTAGFISVAAHSIEVMKLTIERSPSLALEALLHDAAEAYLGDLVRPLKRHPDFQPVYMAAEQLAEQAIAEALNLEFPIPALVMECDNVRLMYEMEHIRDDLLHWDHPPHFEREFLRHYESLKRT